MRHMILVLFAPALVCLVWAGLYGLDVRGDAWVISFLVFLAASYVASEVERIRRWDRRGA